MKTIDAISNLFAPDRLLYRNNRESLVDLSSFRCVFELFRDYLCSDVKSEKFRQSNSYSWFRNNFIPRDLIKKDDKALLILKNKKAPNIAQKL